MQKKDLDEFLREIFEREKEKLEEKELLGEQDASYTEKFLQSVGLMLELEETLSEEQKEKFKQINLLNFEYNLEREFVFFKLGYDLSCGENIEKYN